jgi:hypothetical protein
MPTMRYCTTIGQCGHREYCGRPAKSRYVDGVSSECQRLPTTRQTVSYCGNRPTTTREAKYLATTYVSGCKEGYTCDRLPGYTWMEEVPSACLQAPVYTVESYLGTYCGGGFCGSSCQTPPPCPDGLRCSISREDLTGDSGNKCYPVFS